MLLGKNNPHVKYVRLLSRRKFREREGKFLIEGFRFLEEALKIGWPLELAMFVPRAAQNARGARLLEMLRERGVPAYPVDDQLFKDLAETRSPQGWLAVAQAPSGTGTVGELSTGKGLLVYIDGIQDPGNLGTIIRSTDAAGADGLLVAKGSVDPYNPKTLRSTMGSIFRVPLFHAADPEKTLAELAGCGWKLVAGDPAAATEIYKCDLTGPVVLVVGSEASGVSPAVRRAVHVRVRIPMPGRTESLNAGVAAGIMLYEAVRQRTSAGL